MKPDEAACPRLADICIGTLVHRYISAIDAKILHFLENFSKKITQAKAIWLALLLLVLLKICHDIIRHIILHYFIF